MKDTEKEERLAQLEAERILNAVLDGILVYRSGMGLYRALVRELSVSPGCNKHWIELFWNPATKEHWTGDAYRGKPYSLPGESYITWLAVPSALRKLALDLRLAALP